MKFTIEIFEKAVMQCDENNSFPIREPYEERINSVLDEAVKKDKKYQRLNRKTRKKIGEIDKIELNKEEWLIIDNALSGINERSAEYGRIAYRQGFMDAVNFFKKNK